MLKYVNKLAIAICVVVASVTFLYLIFNLIRYSVDIPSPDGWMMLNYIDKYYQGTLTLKDLFAQHNEHRLIVPKMLLLAIDIPSHWNVYVEIIANVLIGLLIYAVMVSQSFVTYAKDGMRYNHLLLVILSLLCFSITQYENFSTGFQIQILLNILFATTGFFILCRDNMNLKVLAVSVLLGVLALYSFANGLYYWVVGLLPLLHRFIRKELSVKYVFAWIGASLFFVGTYFYHFKNQDTTVSNLFHEPVKVAMYFVRNVGSSIIYVESNPIYSVIVGSAGIAGFILLCYYVVQKKKNMAIPWLALSWYGLVSELSTASGRLDYFSSRYTTIANLFWAGFIVASIYLLNDYFREKKIEFGTKAALSVISAILFGLFIVNTDTFIKYFTRDAELNARIRFELLALDQKQMDQPDIGSPYLQPKLIPTLKKYSLTVFRDRYEVITFSKYSNRIPDNFHYSVPFQPANVNNDIVLLFHSNADLEFTKKPSDRTAIAHVAMKPDAIGKTNGVRFYWEGFDGSWHILNEIEVHPNSIEENNFKMFDANISGNWSKFRLRVDGGDQNDTSYDWSVLKYVNIH